MTDRRVHFSRLGPRRGYAWIKPQQCFLHHVLGRLRVADQAQCIAQQPGLLLGEHAANPFRLVALRRHSFCQAPLKEYADPAFMRGDRRCQLDATRRRLRSSEHGRRMRGGAMRADRENYGASGGEAVLDARQ